MTNVQLVTAWCDAAGHRSVRQAQSKINNARYIINTNTSVSQKPFFYTVQRENQTFSFILFTTTAGPNRIEVKTDHLPLFYKLTNRSTATMEMNDINYLVIYSLEAFHHNKSLYIKNFEWPYNLINIAKLFKHELYGI